MKNFLLWCSISFFLMSFCYGAQQEVDQLPYMPNPTRDDIDYQLLLALSSSSNLPFENRIPCKYQFPNGEKCPYVFCDIKIFSEHQKLHRNRTKSVWCTCCTTVVTKKKMARHKEKKHSKH